MAGPLPFRRRGERHLDGAFSFGDQACCADRSGNREVSGRRNRDAVEGKFFAKKSLLKDPKTVKTYTERLGYFLDWCERSGIKHFDQLTGGDDLLPYVSFLRQRKTTRDTLFEPRYVYNIFQTCNTFLRANSILFAGEILGQLDSEEKEVKPYKPHELKALFQAADDEEQLWMSYFLNTGCREQEVANAEYCDLLDDVNVVWVRSKLDRGFKLKGKRWQNQGRKLPVPTALKEKLRDRMIAQAAKPSDLIFPNTIGGVEGHFLRKLQTIAERAGVVEPELHRFRKSYADTLADEGLPVPTIMKRLGHCSLDMAVDPTGDRAPFGHCHPKQEGHCAIKPLLPFCAEKSEPVTLKAADGPCCGEGDQESRFVEG